MGRVLQQKPEVVQRLCFKNILNNPRPHYGEKWHRISKILLPFFQIIETVGLSSVQYSRARQQTIDKNSLYFFQGYFSSQENAFLPRHTVSSLKKCVATFSEIEYTLEDMKRILTEMQEAEVQRVSAKRRTVQLPQYIVWLLRLRGYKNHSQRLSEKYIGVSRS